MTSKLYPYAGRHAVQSAAFVIKFKNEVGEDAIKEVSASREMLKDHLPDAAPIKTVTMKLKVGTPDSAVSSDSVVGWSFTKSVELTDNNPKRNQFQRSMSVHGTDVVIVENDYDRWAGFKAHALRCLDAIGNPVFRDRQVESFSLQYNDVFEWRGNPADFQISELLSGESPYLPPNLFTLGTGYFHTTHGFFNEDARPEFASSLIENVNAKRVKDAQSGYDRVAITTDHRLVPAESLYSCEQAMGLIEQVLEYLHQRNKKVLGLTLAGDVKTLICLEA